MSINCEFKSGLVMMRGDGSIDTETHATALESLLEHPAFVPGTPVIFNSEQAVYAFSTEEVRQVARLLKHLQAKGLGPMAVVANTPLQFGLARMLGAYASVHGCQYRVCETEQEARNWAMGTARTKPPIENGLSSNQPFTPSS